ncbi:MAG: hypothetical protein M3014_07655, partial [Chloroflexota bacterium]|nr:hypothetical protein [Chloroflexota bacterium]
MARREKKNRSGRKRIAAGNVARHRGTALWDDILDVVPFYYECPPEEPPTGPLPAIDHVALGLSTFVEEVDSVQVSSATAAERTESTTLAATALMKAAWDGDHATE